MGQVIGIAVILGVLGLIYGKLERRYAAIPTPVAWRKDAGTDIGYFFFVATLGKAIGDFGGLLAAILLLILFQQELTKPSADAFFNDRATFISGLPLALQFLSGFLAADFTGYWIHRLFHRRPLWRFHAIHHSSQHLDWLSSVRVHPVNDFITSFLQLFPLVVLGFKPLIFASVGPFFIFYGLLLHSNVPWDFGPFRTVFASPAFHRWHHTSEAHGIDKNFAGLFPIWDLLFGTFYLPHHQPTQFGITEPIPSTFWHQLMWPFRTGGSTSR